MGDAEIQLLMTGTIQIENNSTQRVKDTILKDDRKSADRFRHDVVG